MNDGTKEATKHVEPALGTEIFHRLQNVLVDSQTACVISVNTKAGDALRQLNEAGRSHLPVVNGGMIVGMFSYRSFASGVLHLAEGGASTEPPTEVEVVQFIEDAAFRRAEDKIDDVMPTVRELGAVVVGQERDFDGVATLHDMMDHVFRFAQPFVLLTEVEQALRALMKSATTADELATFSRNIFFKRHGASTPTRVEDMTFGQYQQIICHEQHFPTFQPVFGGTSTTVRSKLEPVRGIRNDIFHFKRAILKAEYATLKNTRNWLSFRLMLSSSLGTNDESPCP